MANVQEDEMIGDATLYDPTESELLGALHQAQERMCLTGIDMKSPLSATGHATVFRGYSMTYKIPVAIKVINRNYLPPEVADKFLPRELEATRLAHHPHLCKCLEILHPSQMKIVIITEYYTGGNLFYRIKRHGAISENNSARMFRQLIEAVNFLHEHNVVHRDIKTGNIFLDGKGDVKLGDFGFARHIARAERSTSFCGSRPHQSPNIIRSKPYNAYAADWYAVGICLYAMLTGTIPEDQVDPDTHEYRPLFYSSGRPSEAARRLIALLVCEDENKRAGYHACLNSEWLSVNTNGKWITADNWFIYDMQK